MKDSFLENREPISQVSKRAERALSDAWGGAVPMCKVTVTKAGRQPETHIVLQSELEDLERRYADEPVTTWDVAHGFAQVADPEDEA